MAAWTLFELAYRAAREVGPTYEGSATGGTQTTIIDTIRLKDNFSDDWFNGGSAWILYDAAGAGAAPQGETARISDFVKSSGTITLSAALTAAVAAADRYALCSNRFNIDRIIAAINGCLGRLLVPTVDKTTLDTAANKLEYNLPAAVLDENIEVFMQSYTSDVDSNMPVQLHNWYVEETGTGVQKQIIFHSQPIYTRDLWIKYWLPHPPLYAASDKLREGVPISQVVYQSAAQLLQDELSMMSSGDPRLVARIQSMLAKAADWTPGSQRQSHKLATFGVSEVYSDDVNQG